MTLSTDFITWLKLCCRCVHVIKVWQHRNERSYHNLNFIRILSGKPLFCGVVLVKVQLFGAETRYGLVLFNQYGKKFKSKSQKVNSYVFKSYRGITKIELICPPPPPLSPMLHRFKSIMTQIQNAFMDMQVGYFLEYGK